MKIEVCESLVSSWFKHVKGCSIVQTNWSVSPCWGIDYTRFDKVCKDVHKFFLEKYSYTVFKGANIEQFIKQGEADVVGIKIKNDQTSVYAADTAFHENGLNYGAVDKTVSRVLKKFFRTAITLNAVYGNVSDEIAFISPKINRNILEPLKTAISDLQVILNKNGFKFTLALYANDSFTNNVLIPTMKITKQVSDDNELFLRSLQMAELARNNLKNNSEVSARPKDKSNYNNVPTGNIKVETRAKFEIHLRNRRYAETTVFEYPYAIEKYVLQRENLSWNAIADPIVIDKIVSSYDVGGIYEDIGKIGHNTVICALKRFKEFVFDNNLEQENDK